MKGVMVDEDKTLGYEINSFIRSVWNILLVSILNFLPTNIRNILKKTHRSAEIIIKYAGTNKATEILYNRQFSNRSGNLIQRFFLSIWLNTNNSKAIRNRLRLVKREIKKKFLNLASQSKKIEVLNIASGSSRAILESIDEISLPNQIDLSATFVDIDHEAILLSQRLASNNNSRFLFKWVNDSAQNFIKKNNKKTFDLVEIVGLLEYLEDKEIIQIFSEIYHILESDGIVITTNIRDNMEREFISRIVGWKMNYRTTEEFVSLLIAGGFVLDKMKIYYEPQHIHCIIVAQK